MGLHATTSKRKHDTEFDKKERDLYLSCSPVKSSKWSTESNLSNGVNDGGGTTQDSSITKLEVVAAAPCETWNTEPVVDCISKLQAVAVPTDTWGSISTKSTLATTLLSAEQIDDDEDEFEDDYEEEESIIPTYCPLRYPLTPHRNYSPHGYTKPSFYSEPFPQQNCSRTGNQITRPGNFNWNQNGGYYVPGEASYTQQTIRCAENGKSYLELGSSSLSTGSDAVHSKRCCDGRGTWCNSKSCYKEIRLKIRNLSMFKLSRFRQVSEQSLYRSVLICNTLKKIDNEIECEGRETSTGINIDYSPSMSNCPRIPIPHSLGSNNQGFQQQSHFSNISSNGDNRDCSSTFNQLNSMKSSTVPFNSIQCPSDSLHPYDHYPFRDNQSGRATPFPPPTSIADSDSGYGDEDNNRSINWSSVLSLSSQSALDPLNNNDLFSTLLPNSPTTTAISGTFTASSVSNSVPQGSTTGVPSWEYGFLDMDLGLGPEFTELVPSCKIPSDDLFKNVSPSISSSRYVHENELESPAHIMVGS